MTYVRAYNRPDLLLTFTCNPTWNEFKELLIAGLSSSVHHDTTACIFKHASRFLVWLINEITPDKIDKFISELPDKANNPDLFNVVTKNMFHDPCGAFNYNSPHMSEGKCTQRYPRNLISDTITGIDGYPVYHRRLVEDDSKSIVLKERNEKEATWQSLE